MGSLVESTTCTMHALFPGLAMILCRAFVVVESCSIFPFRKGLSRQRGTNLIILRSRPRARVIAYAE